MNKLEALGNKISDDKDAEKRKYNNSRKYKRSQWKRSRHYHD